MTASSKYTRPADITEREWSYAWRQMFQTGRSLDDVIADIRRRKEEAR